MTSEIRANTIKNRVGLGTVSYTNTGIVVSGIVTANSFSGTGDLDVDGHTNLDNVSIAGVTTMTGALTISSTTDQMLNLNSSDNNGTSLAFQRNGSRQGYIGYGGASAGLIIANEYINGAVAIQGNDGGSIINMLSFATDNKGLATLHGGATIPLDLDVDGHTNLDNVSIAGVSTVTTFLQVLGQAGTSDKGFEVRANSTQNTDTNKAIRIRNNSNTDTFNISYKGKVTATELDISGNIDVDGHTNLDNVNIAGITTVSSNLVVSGQIFQSRPNDLWTTGSAFYEIAGLGNLTTQGSYETTLTSNGYRDTNGQWVSYASNSFTGASQIRLNPQGYIIFGAESSKSNGATHVVTERLRIDQEGIRSPGGTFNIRNNSSTGNVTINVLGVSGDSRIDLENTGDGNYSGIDFIRERQSGTGVVGGSIFMKSDTSTNDAYLYIQAQSASAQSPVTTALSADNGVRLKLQGGDGVFAIETGASERLRIKSNGDVEWNGTGTATPGVSNSTVGMGFEPRNGTIFLSRGDNATLLSNRNNDGRHIHFSQGGTQKFAIGLQSSGADLTFNSGAGVSPTERLRITSVGETKFTRGTVGGQESIGNVNNTWWKVGTWAGAGVDAAARATITVLGANTHNANNPAGGETKIYLSITGSAVYASFYSHTDHHQGVIGVAHKYDPSASSCEIWVKYSSGYSSTSCFADVTNGFFTGASVNTGSSSTPSGATLATSKFVLRTSDGTASSERLVIDSNGNADFNVAGGELDIYSTGSGDQLSLRLLNSDASAGNKIGIYFGPANNVAGAYIKGVAESDFTSAANRDAGLEFGTRLNATFLAPLKISAAGYVTKAQQPGFFAYMNGGNQTTNGNNIIPFDQTHFNTGGHFKTSGTNAYKFVCPVAGIYHFSGAIWMKNANTGAHARWQIRKNDVIQCQAGWHQNQNNNDFYDHSAPASITIYCDAGDRVHAHADYQIQYWRGGGTHPHTYFCGHLVG